MISLDGGDMTSRRGIQSIFSQQLDGAVFGTYNEHVTWPMIPCQVLNISFPRTNCPIDFCMPPILELYEAFP